MRLQVGLRPGVTDLDGERVAGTLRGAGGLGRVERVESSTVYLLEGVDHGTARRLAEELLADPVTERFSLDAPLEDAGGVVVEILRHPGVTDPVEGTLREAARMLGIAPGRVKRIRRLCVRGEVAPDALAAAARRLLYNPVVEAARVGRAWEGIPPDPPPSPFVRREVQVRALTDAQLGALSASMGLSLSVVEMRVVADHFTREGREPTDVEIETVAQTWSEHCLHKTFRSPVRMGAARYGNLLSETVFEATRAIAAPWCVSVFRDNAGVVAFDDKHHLCIKVETHNHPSAIEPFGGAGTGVGGVIRDILGTGLGAKPIANLDVFCVGLPDAPAPAGERLAPAQTLAGVVAGVRDYGNPMGIPTVAGAVCFDPGYDRNPLVFCGTVGLLPAGCERKAVRPGDRIVVAGGRTGRDGIHGATFSSAALADRTDDAERGAVQIGDPIVQKRMQDVLLVARDRGWYTAVTDCGAGGLSSAVGEMAAETGARVDLEAVPLKYAGLTYREIWISEAQERMVLSVPAAHVEPLRDLFSSEGVEATDIGQFASDGRLRLRYRGAEVADLPVALLFEACPRPERAAVAPAPAAAAPAPEVDDPAGTLRALLSTWNVCSRAWIVRQYDHEVQGGSVLKSTAGPRAGPADGVVIAPVPGSTRGFALGVGIRPGTGALDPYAMAAGAIDEAVRQVVACGADPARVALLDNFCWGDTRDPAQMGALVRASEACRDVARALGTPFVSGKDSLHNSTGTRSIPPTLLVTALGIVPDVRAAVSADFKEPGNRVGVLGLAVPGLGGSELHRLLGETGDVVPQVDPSRARATFAALHAAISAGWVRACHDVSDGGLAVALAEMAFAGGIGVSVRPLDAPAERIRSRAEALFGESPTRFVLEVTAAHADEAERAFRGVPFAWIGRTHAAGTLVLEGLPGGEIRMDLDDLRTAWAAPLPRVLGGPGGDVL